MEFRHKDLLGITSLTAEEIRLILDTAASASGGMAEVPRAPVLPGHDARRRDPVNDPIIQLSGVSYSYPNEARLALADINISIRPGEHVDAGGEDKLRVPVRLDVFQMDREYPHHFKRARSSSPSTSPFSTCSRNAIASDTSSSSFPFHELPVPINSRRTSRSISSRFRRSVSSNPLPVTRDRWFLIST